MDLSEINDILYGMENDEASGRDHILALSEAVIRWMGFTYVENNKPRLLDFKTLKLKDALAPAPVTGQEQIYRLTAEGQNIRIRFVVLKKFDKKMIQYLVDNNVGLASYQAGMRGIKQMEGREPYISRQPYFVHFIATAKYDKLWLVFNEGEQKRILTFQKRLSHTQYYKILPSWNNIAAKPKPEMAKLFWSSLDVKEVNKEFYKYIKEQFDALVGIAKAQTNDKEENAINQFAVRLIGRYIFCWFLKEKEIIPTTLFEAIDLFPLDNIGKDKQKFLTDGMEKIISIKAQNQDTTAIEREIDLMVYKFFEFTGNQVKVMDKELERQMSWEEYENLDFDFFDKTVKRELLQGDENNVR